MYLEIVSPEATLYSGEVSLITLPGTDGSFQLMDNHAPIVSLLAKGTVKVKGNAGGMTEKLKKHFKQGKEASELLLDISSGTVEMKENKVIVLAD